MNLRRTAWRLAWLALFAPLAVSWSASERTTGANAAVAGETVSWIDSFQWSDWQLVDEVVERDGEPFAGWESVRAMREVDSLLAKAIVVPVENGAECLLSYGSARDWDGDPTGRWLRFVPVGAIAHIFTFPALPQALKSCQEAVDRKLTQQSALKR